MRTIKLFFVALAVAMFLIACSQSATTPNTSNATANGNKPATASPTTPQPAATPDEVAMAKDLYVTNCANCHKDNGKGGKVTIDGKQIDPDDIANAKTAGKSDEKLTGYINEGFPDDGMPAFKDKLKPDQVKMIIKHMRTLQKGTL